MAESWSRERRALLLAPEPVEGAARERAESQPMTTLDRLLSL
jgi:hypothetical protein